MRRFRRGGGALYKRFPRRENLDAGRIQFARADEGRGPLTGLGPLGQAQAPRQRNADWRKAVSGKSEVRDGRLQGPERGGAFALYKLFSLKEPDAGRI